MNKVFKEPPSKLTPLTRTQKRGLQTARVVQKMKNTLKILAEAKEKDKQEIPVASIAKLLDQAFPNLLEASTPVEEPVNTHKLGTI